MRRQDKFKSGTRRRQKKFAKKLRKRGEKSLRRNVRSLPRSKFKPRNHANIR